jgi:hypothetical protein
MKNQFKVNVQYLLRDLIKFNDEPHIIKNLVKNFEKNNAKEL